MPTIGSVINVTGGSSQNVGLTAGSTALIQPVTVANFSATGTLRLLAANAVAGATMILNVTWPGGAADSSTILHIVDDASGSDLVHVYGQNPAGFTSTVTLYFNGTSWVSFAYHTSFNLN